MKFYWHLMIDFDGLYNYDRGFNQEHLCEIILSLG